MHECKMPHNRRFGGKQRRRGPILWIIGPRAEIPCSAIFSELDRWKILVIIPDQSTLNYLSIQLFRLFLTSKVQEKFPKQNSTRQLRQIPRTGDDGRHFARAQELFENDRILMKFDHQCKIIEIPDWLMLITAITGDVEDRIVSPY